MGIYMPLVVSLEEKRDSLGTDDKRGVRKTDKISHGPLYTFYTLLLIFTFLLFVDSPIVPRFLLPSKPPPD
jgi:hypothetical protein